MWTLRVVGGVAESDAEEVDLGALLVVEVMNHRGAAKYARGLWGCGILQIIVGRIRHPIELLLSCIKRLSGLRGVAGDWWALGLRMVL